MNRYYTGIGNLDVDMPMYWSSLIREIVEMLYNKEFILRSGGAEGTDSMFEKHAGNKKETYLPFKGFNGSDSELYFISDEAKQLAVKFHPMGERLLTSQYLNYHARKGYQILGYELDTPVEFIITCTSDINSDGTSHALRIAKAYDIPIYNLHDMGDKELNEFWLYLKSL